jgi:serine/threonine-protein kinase
MPATESARLWAGRYELGQELGAGGLATVCRGRLVGPGGFARPVAIKRLHRHLGRHADAAMFLDEARIASCIVHPNVVATLDVVAEEGEYVVVMELVEGPTLERLLTIAPSGRPPLPVTLRILSDVLHGLQAAHEATDARGEALHVVHRDVAPSNVLVGRDGIAKISDFGVAKARGRLASTRNGEVKGHLSYMAPEQLVGDAIDARADVFGAGVVLWEALTGRRLFHGENEAQVVYALLERTIAPPRTVAPELPVAIDAVVMRALSREAAARFPSARAMADALGAVAPVATHAEVTAWIAAQEETSAGAMAIEARAIEADTWLDPAPPAAPARKGRAGAAIAITIAAGVAAILAILTGGRPSASASAARETTAIDAPAAITGGAAATAAPIAIDPPTADEPSAPSDTAPKRAPSARPAPHPAARPATRPHRATTPVRHYERD